MPSARLQRSMFWRVTGTLYASAALCIVLTGCLSSAALPVDEVAGATATKPLTDAAPASDTPHATAVTSHTRSTVGITAADGFIAEASPLSPFDDDHPAIANLDPQIRSALQDAAADAGEVGVYLVVNSGWRSERYQQSLLDEAIVTYGSTEEARKWVNSPEQSTHVTGDAVDVGPTDGAIWLSQHGSRYGLCQVYVNEIWHYEFATDRAGNCPTPLEDASSASGAT